MFQYTTAIDKLRDLTKPIRVIDGGTFAAKTDSIIARYIHLCAITKEEAEKYGDEWFEIIDCTCVAESVPALKGGVIKIFKRIMSDTGRWNEDSYNYTDRIYTFSNNKTIQFSAFDTVGKAQAAGKRTHLFINEAPYIPYPIVDALMTRTTQEVTFDFNPTHEFYVHTEILTRKDIDHLTLTYEDNETTPDRIKEDFEIKKAKAFYDPNKEWNEANVKSSYWANWCRVYIKGELGSLEGVIFQDWQIIDNPPPYGLEGYGLDFGYSGDPNTWIACYRYEGKRIFDEVIYQKGLDNKTMALKMRENGNTDKWTYADSSEPKSIDEISGYGVNIRGASKGKDSINFGIRLLQEEPFYVTSRSLNLIKELRNYSWSTNRDGSYSNHPEDNYNHCIDAMRYFAMENWTKSNEWTPQITVAGFN